jgi:hypothetical protein
MSFASSLGACLSNQRSKIACGVGAAAGRGDPDGWLTRETVMAEMNTPKRGIRSRVGALIAVAASVVAVSTGALGWVGAGTALAGTNGQQIHIINPEPSSTAAVQVRLIGTNQNGDMVDQTLNFPQGGDIWDSNWWWTGPVTVEEFGPNQWVGGFTVDVPSYQFNNDWYTFTSGWPPSLSFTSSQNPASPGVPVTFTATLNPGLTGPDGAPAPQANHGYVLIGPISQPVAGPIWTTEAPWVNGVATVTTSSLVTGTQIVQAEYTNHADSTDPIGYYVDQLNETVVSDLPTTTTLTFNPEPVAVGQSYTVTANVSSTGGQARAGTVTFYSEGADVSTVTLDGTNPGVATITAQAPAAGGPVTWQAVYSGDPNDGSSQSAVVDQSAIATTTDLSFGPDPVSVGQSYTVTATVAAPGLPAATGTVTFYSEGTYVATASLSGAHPDVATITSVAPPAAGPVTWQAVYNGDSNVSSGESAVVDETTVAATG